SVATAAFGGVAWLVAEPDARGQLLSWAGIEDPLSEPNAGQKPLDLTRHPDAQPSFNCDDATTTIERLICSDPAMAEADRSLGVVWSNLAESELIDDDLRMAQRRWIARRDACLIAEDPSNCAKAAMLERISELSAR
ncbi:MAG: lysozyme inhibitor LprI family protein, partial [Pseudomonadota bacterium]